MDTITDSGRATNTSSARKASDGSATSASCVGLDPGGEQDEQRRDQQRPQALVELEQLPTAAVSRRASQMPITVTASRPASSCTSLLITKPTIDERERDRVAEVIGDQEAAEGVVEDVRRQEPDADARRPV